MPSQRREARIAIRIEGTCISPTRFREAVDALLGIIREVTNDYCGTPTAMSWSAFTEAGSTVFGVVLIPTKPPLRRYAPWIAGSVAKGIARVSGKRAVRPDRFSDCALEHARTLAEVASKKNEGISRVSVSGNGRSVAIRGDRAAANISEIIGGVIKEEGTVEGRLVSLSGIGQLRGRLYDDMTNEPVACFFATALLGELKHAWNERVELCGLVHYTPQGVPKQINVSSMRVFPDPSELPRWSDLRGALSE